MIYFLSLFVRIYYSSREQFIYLQTMPKRHSFIFILIFLSVLLSCNKETEGIIADTVIIPRGTVVQSEIIPSEILQLDMHYSIYLPPDYDVSSKDYPVLYLLHGMWGNYLDWVTNGMSSVVNSLIYTEEAKEMIIVMPDGIDSFYCNNFNGGSLLYEDFMIQEFIPQIENKYRINSTQKGRAIAGLSMGGYGATFHAFKRPDMFCYCYSMSGALGMGASAPDLTEIINAKTTEELAEIPAYTMECGTEDYLVYSSNESFDLLLTEKGIVHNYIERTGVHDWTFWMGCLPKVLKAVSEEFE